MKHDSQEWRELRNQHLNTWIGDPHAVAFLLDIFNVGEVWDDLIDQDKSIAPDDINKAFYTALITLPNNPFYRAYQAQLSGVMVSGIHAWLDANKLEQGAHNDRVLAYVLRDWYMELITLVAQLLHGFEYVRTVSVEIRHFFTHETLDQYIGSLS